MATAVGADVVRATAAQGADHFLDESIQPLAASRDPQLGGLGDSRAALQLLRDLFPGALEDIGEHDILTLPNVAFRQGVSKPGGSPPARHRRRVTCESASMFSRSRPDIALRYSQPSAFARRHELHHCSVNDVSASVGRLSGVRGDRARCFVEDRCLVEDGRRDAVMSTAAT